MSMRRDCQWSIREWKIDWRFRECVYVFVWFDIRTIGQYKSYVNVDLAVEYLSKKLIYW